MTSGRLQTVSICLPGEIFPGSLYQVRTGGTTSEATTTPRRTPMTTKRVMVRPALIARLLVRREAVCERPAWSPSCRRRLDPDLQLPRPAEPAEEARLVVMDHVAGGGLEGRLVQELACRRPLDPAQERAQRVL